MEATAPTGLDAVVVCDGSHAWILFEYELSRQMTVDRPALVGPHPVLIKLEMSGPGWEKTNVNDVSCSPSRENLLDIGANVMMRCRISDRWVQVIVVLILCVAVATVVAAYQNFHEFMVLQSRRNCLVLVHMALSQYQEQHGRLPAMHSKENDAGVVESWRISIAPLLRNLRSQRSPGSGADSEDWADVQRIFHGSDVGGCVMAVFHTRSVWSEPNDQSAVDPAINDDPVIAVFWPDANVDWRKPVDLVVHGERVAFWTPEGEGMAIVSMRDVFLLRRSGQIDFLGGSTSTTKMANLLVE